MASYLDIERLSELVRSKRGNRGLREMAAIIGVSPSTILRVEKGTVPDVATFLAICDWIEMPPAELIRNMSAIRWMLNRGNQPVHKHPSQDS